MSSPTPRQLPRPLILAPLLAAALLRPAGAETASSISPGPWEWSGISRVVAVGDVHGNHDKLTRLLAAADLIDDEHRWTGGQDHLVVAGDILDRGLDDRLLMDLLRRLQQESLAAGGRVHVLLGNHEVMNLFRDLRYVNPDSYRHFAADEAKETRKTAAGEFAKRQRGDWAAAHLREFNDRFPPGYFARLASLNPDGEYGSWLMRLPTVVKINGVAYTHGGLKAEFAALGVDGINRRMSRRLEQYLSARTILEQEGVVTPVMQTLEVIKAAEEVADRKRRNRPSPSLEAAKALLEAADAPILGREGPIWYRGNSLQDERLERDILNEALQLLDATALVVAHSPTMNRQITSRFHSRLFRIDHGIGGSDTPLALVAEHGETLVLDSNTGRTRSPLRESPIGQLGASRNARLSDKQLAHILANSPVIAVRALGKGSTLPQLVVLKHNGEIRRGVFKTVSGSKGTDRYQHEVAAYQLDRTLGLHMVPVTVTRQVGGQAGSVQAWIDGALDLETARGYNLEFFENEGRAGQLEIARIFDALIGNTSRKPADILGLVKHDRVMLIDHSKAFSTSHELPSQALEGLHLSAPLAAALEGLNREALIARLGKLLSIDQIDALLARRDKILRRNRTAAKTSP